jgi:hypothetical protein
MIAIIYINFAIIILGFMILSQILPAIKEKLADDKAIIILGPRQAGHWLFRLAMKFPIMS